MPRPEARIFRLPTTASHRAASPAVRSLVMALALVLLATSCNRLTFVKPDTARKGFERTAPEVSVGATQRSRDVEAAQAHLQLSKVRLLHGD